MNLFIAALLTISNDKPLEIISGWDKLVPSSGEYCEAITLDQPVLFSEDQSIEIQMLGDELATGNLEWDAEVAELPEELTETKDIFSSLKGQAYTVLKSQVKEEQIQTATFRPTLEHSTLLAQAQVRLGDGSKSQAIPQGDIQSGDDSKGHITPQEINYYAHLIITAHQKDMIETLLTNLAEKSKVVLLWQQGKWEKLGKQINAGVHPVRFLGTVFTDRKLIWCLRQIRRDFWKWRKFIEGFSNRMKEEADQKNLVKYIPGFAEAVYVDQKEIFVFIEKREYDKLVIYLLELYK